MAATRDQRDVHAFRAISRRRAGRDPGSRSRTSTTGSAPKTSSTANGITNARHLHRDPALPRRAWLSPRPGPAAGRAPTPCSEVIAWWTSRRATAPSISKLASTNGISEHQPDPIGPKARSAGWGQRLGVPGRRMPASSTTGAFPGTAAPDSTRATTSSPHYEAEVRAPVSGTVKFKTGALGGNQFNLIGSRRSGVHRKPSRLDRQERQGERRRRHRLRGHHGQRRGDPSPSPLRDVLWAAAVNPYPILIANGCK